MSTYLKAALIIALATFCSRAVLGQADSIDVFIRGQMQQRGIPGLQLAIVHKGKIIKTGNYGWANIQDSIAVSEKTVFSINSITKAFTGVAIIQLMEEGKLNLEAPISTYLPDLPLPWQKVTVQQLLSHTSGIPDIVDEEESVMIAAGADAAWTKVVQLPNDFAPGEKFSYNQTNYLLLGRIIDKLGGMPFQEVIRKGQLEKAGMSRTIRSGFGATKEIVPNAACSYQYSKGKLTNMFFSFPPFLQTAAGMSATAGELARWVIALQSGQLLKNEASLAALWKPALLTSGETGGFSNQLNGYAAGWPVALRKSHPAYGAVGGGRSALFIYPHDDLSIIVLTNLSGGSPDVFIDQLAGFFVPGMKEENGFGRSPSLHALIMKLDKAGYSNAAGHLDALRKERPGFRLTERELNTLGYKLMSQKRMKHALEIFKLNVHLYPASGNAYDSLGETYAELGEKELAIKHYEQALKLDPKNKNAEEQLRRLR